MARGRRQRALMAAPKSIPRPYHYKQLSSERGGWWGGGPAPQPAQGSGPL